MNGNTMPAGNSEDNSGDTSVLLITGAYTAISIYAVAGLLAGRHPEELTATESWTRALFLGWFVSLFPALIATLFIERFVHGPTFPNLQGLKGQPLQRILGRIGIVTLPLTATIVGIAAVLAQLMA